MADYSKMSDAELDAEEARLLQKVSKSKPSYESMTDEELDAEEARLVSKIENDRPVAAGLESAGDMVLAGYAPNIKGGIVEGLSYLGADRAKALATLDSPIEDLFSGKAYENLPKLNSYTDTRDYADKKAKGLLAENPKAALGGMVLGALAPLPFGKSKALVEGGKAVKASKLATLGKLGAKGAASAAIYNPGNKEGEVTPLQLKERAENAAYGGGLSVLLGGAGMAASSAAEKAKNSAYRWAARALGRGTKGMKEKLGDKGVVEMGEAALKNDVIGIIPRGIKKIEERVEKLRQKAGAHIEDVINQIDEVEKVAVGDGYKVGISKKSIADKVMSEVADPDNFPDPDFVQRVEKRLGSFLKTGGKDEMISTKGIHTIKTRLGASMEKGGVWKRIKMGSATPDDMFLNTMYHTLGDAVLDSATGVSKIVENPGLSKKVTDANKLYKAAKNMGKFAKDEVNRSNTNNPIMQLTPLLLGGAAYAGGQDAKTSAALALGAQALKRGGPQMAAKGLQGLSKILSAAGNTSVNAKAIGLITGKVKKDKREEDDAMKRRMRGN